MTAPSHRPSASLARWSTAILLGVCTGIFAAFALHFALHATQSRDKSATMEAINIGDWWFREVELRLIDEPSRSVEEVAASLLPELEAGRIDRPAIKYSTAVIYPIELNPTVADWTDWPPRSLLPDHESPAHVVAESSSGIWIVLRSVESTRVRSRDDLPDWYGHGVKIYAIGATPPAPAEGH